MTLTKRGSLGLASTRTLLNHLIELPDLARVIQALPAETFAALVREVGVEDAGEIIALATTEQLVQAFDEDLFVSGRAGERETFDVGRFVVWLEVLLEAGDQVAADRVAELDEDFVAHALSGVVRVLDADALRERLDEGDEDESRQVDKALESALTEDLDGHILVARQHDGWDAALSLILALDRNHSALLARLLDRLAQVGRGQLDDLEALATLLSEGESLAEDAEAAREERRSKQGHVEAQAARAFLSLARKPLHQQAGAVDCDPLTRAYFRAFDRSRQLASAARAPGARESLAALPPAVQRALDQASDDTAGLTVADSPPRATPLGAFMDALRALHRAEPRVFADRVDELAYLANVLVAGHQRRGARLGPKAASDAALATVCYGAVSEVRGPHPAGQREAPPSPDALFEVLRTRSIDLLFRIASSALASGAAPNVGAAQKAGLLYSAEELEAAIR